jgi:RNA polymerase sigma factor (TIGR02999 family)
MKRGSSFARRPGSLLRRPCISNASRLGRCDRFLIEAARRRRAEKRGGDAALVTFDESLQAAATTSDDLLALDEALKELARIEPRQATLVESRFFGGLDVAETAALLEISESTVLRDWRAAKAWLARELRGGALPPTRFAPDLRYSTMP